MTRIRLLLVAAFVVILGVLFLPTASYADAVVPVTTDSNSLAQVKISPFVMQMILAWFIPLVTGYITKLSHSSSTKGLITLFLNLVATMVGAAVMVGGDYVFTKETVITALLGFVMSHVSYKSVLKPRGLTSSAWELPNPAQPGHTVNMPGRLATRGVTD